MNETRDEWIQNEARAACERYWSAATPCDWRNVVAPFYDLHVRASEARPVKVRFDVTAEDLAAKVHYALHGGWPELSQEGDRTKAAWIDTAKIAMHYLADHAVIDVPPGVPKIGSLMAAANLAEPTYPITSKQVAAIRDAVLAAVQPPVADADTLEKLAEVGLRAKEKVWGGPIKMNLKAEVAGVAAVLRAAKPRIDYEQIRVAFSECKSPREWAEYINSRIRYRFELPEHATVRAPVDIDGLAKAIRDGWWGIGMGTEVYEDLRAAANAALAYLNIEPCAAPEYNPDDVALTPNERNELTNLRAECENQAKTIKAMCEENAKLRHEVEVERYRANDLRTRLAATAAKSARRRKALRQLNGAFSAMHATVSRAIDMREQAKPREWTDADAEELAKVIRRAYLKSASSYIAARAALAWFDGKRGEA